MSLTPGTIKFYVLLGSATGVYGGPYDVALGQAKLMSHWNIELTCGYLAGDAPLVRHTNQSMHLVRHVLGGKSFFDISSFRQLRATFKVSKADLLHLSLARGIGPLLTLALCRLRKTPLVIQTHGMLTSRSSKLLKAFDSLVTKPLIGSHGLVIALTETEKLDLIAWNRDLENNLVVVGNPPLANLEDNAPIRSGKNVLFVARLHKRKAPIDFASAAEFSSRSGWDEVYDMLGPDEGELESVLKKTRDLDNFQYLGATDLRGVVRAVAECGVFVLCSQNEPWGNVLATALEFGKPVVVTQSSALASLVEKYDAGIIVDEGSPEQIAGAVHSMLEVDKYKSYSANARKLAELEFGLAATKNKLEHIYRLAIGRRVEH